MTVRQVTLRLIPAAEVDHERAARIINAAFAIYPFMTVDRTSPEGLPEEIGETAEMILAECGGEIVGCAMVRPARDMAEGEAGPDDALYFGLAAVVPARMRQGIGRLMVARAEVEAARRGFAKVTLTTLREMGNVEYYETLGYRSVGFEDLPIGHWAITIPHQLHTMEKEIAMPRSAPGERR
jgi:GNAT superfamily N-acetyltransferase